MTRKSFFMERTTAEIRNLAVARVYSQRGLVERIDDLNTDESLEIRTRLLPAQFVQGNVSWLKGAQKCYKHGNLIVLSQPRTQGDAYECREIPLAIRKRDFDKLREMREEEINHVGYSWYPVQGRDRRKRKVPFIWIAEGHRIFSYAENKAGGIEVKPYADAERAKKEGATVLCKVPSRTKKKPRYDIKVLHVPTEGVTERRAVCWSLKTKYEEGKEPEHSTFGNIRYRYETDAEASDIFTFYPQDITAYIAIIKYFNEKNNLTPIEMSPLALMSKRGARIYNRMNNNVIIYDPTLTSKDKLRKLYLAEKSILLARAVGVFDNDEIMFWDPARDGRLKDYDWNAE